MVTNKTNFLVALSPYFVPFWSLILLLIAWPISVFVTFPFQREVFLYLMGGSWLFHFLWTLWMIPRDQPDLKENGTFFSIIVIYLANVVILSAMLCLAMRGDAFYSFAYRWWTLFLESVAWSAEWIHSMVIK